MKEKFYRYRNNAHQNIKREHLIFVLFFSFLAISSLIFGLFFAHIGRFFIITASFYFFYILILGLRRGIRPIYFIFNHNNLTIEFELSDNKYIVWELENVTYTQGLGHDPVYPIFLTYKKNNSIAITYDVENHKRLAELIIAHCKKGNRFNTWKVFFKKLFRVK